MQAIWFIPTTIVGGAIAIREVHRDATRHRERMAAAAAAGSGELAADERT